MNEILTINDLEFEVRRSCRRKTLGLTVDRFGELVVHAPEQSDVEELRSFLKKKMLWVHRKLLLKNADKKHQRIVEPVSGETIPYLGHNYRLRVVDRQSESLVFDGEWFSLSRKDADSISKVFKRWYRSVGLEWMTVRVKRWEPNTSSIPTGILIEELGYRWASCSKSGVLRFNWKLLQLPVRLIDYVIVHELTHLKEHNHSEAFWDGLDQALPDWPSRKEELAHSAGFTCTTGELKVTS